MAAWLRGFAATPQSSTSGRGRDLQSTGEGSSLPAWSLPAAQQELSSRHSPGGPSQLPSTSEASSLPSWSRGLPSAEQEAQPSTSGRTSVQWPQAVWKAEVLLAGGTAGAVSKTATAPLSRLTILLQVQALSAGQQHQQQRTPSLFRAFASVIRQEGLLSLWKGNGVTILHRLPYSAVNFWTYEHVLAALQRRSRANPERKLRQPGLVLSDVLSRLVAGAAAGASACTLAYPLDLVRTRLAAQTSSHYYQGIRGTLRTIVRDEGVTGLYRGIGPTLLQTVPSLAINYCAYETLRSRWLCLTRTDTPTVAASLVCGSLAGLVSSTLTFPLDLVRRRLQLEGQAGAGRRYQGYLDVFRQVVRHQGLRGLYSGIVPDYCKVVPGVAITFCVYELGKRALAVESNAMQR